MSARIFDLCLGLFSICVLVMQQKSLRALHTEPYTSKQHMQTLNSYREAAETKANMLAEELVQPLRPIYLSIYLSIYPFIHLSIYLSDYL